MVAIQLTALSINKWLRPCWQGHLLHCQHRPLRWPLRLVLFLPRDKRPTCTATTPAVMRWTGFSPVPVFFRAVMETSSRQPITSRPETLVSVPPACHISTATSAPSPPITAMRISWGQLVGCLASQTEIDLILSRLELIYG